MDKNELISKFKLSSYSDCRNKMSFGEFMNLADTRCITDFDGDGCLLYKGCLVNNADICVDEQTIRLNGLDFRLLISFNEINKLIGKYLEVDWINN